MDGDATGRYAGPMNLSGSEVVGTRKLVLRQVGQMSTDDLVSLWTRTSSAIVKRGFVLEYRDLEPPRTGEK